MNQQCRHCYKATRNCPYYKKGHCTYKRDKNKEYMSIESLLKLGQVEVKICKK